MAVFFFYFLSPLVENGFAYFSPHRYENQEIALNCGTMLRECVRHEPLAKIILQSEDFYRFFSYVEVSTFDIASDAFATFKDLLTKHKILCAQFLEANYDKVGKRKG